MQKYKIIPGKGLCSPKPNINTGRPEKCEVDHLISLDLGGSNDIKNVWIQPYTEHPGAHEKDGLEGWLQAGLCCSLCSQRTAHPGRII